MLLRCTKRFETREDGYPKTIDEGTVWQKVTHQSVMGGYELAVLEEVVDGAYTANQARVRLEKLEFFEVVPMNEIAVPIGCTVFHGTE